ncbi:MAG: hypothetical protein GX922_02960 [Firmicutes bacterium]|nr:hypothetical protein [Bacillota bacterium]
MKRLIFGALVFLCGMAGILVLLVLAVNNPWDYNGITGILGFLLGSQTLFAFIIFIIMFTGGLAICFYEAYFKK